MKLENETRQAFVVCAAVVRDNKILLLLRNEEKNPRAHLKWELPGGKIEFGEHPEEAAIRETLEEAGIKIKITKMLPFVQNSYWDYDWGRLQAICIVYSCLYIGKQSVINDPKVKEIKWFDLDKIKDLDTLDGTKEIVDILKKELG